MDKGRFALATGASYAVLLGLGYLIHGIWLAPIYQEYASVWRLEEIRLHKMWILWLGELVFAVMFVWIYSRGVEEKPWPGQGLRYGVAMALLVVVPTVLTEYVVYPVPYRLALDWLAGGAVQMLACGLVVAAIMRKRGD
jgi:hypothetical protein